MLKKAEGKWEFESEAELENFVWTHLESLLGLKPLKRQHSDYYNIEGYLKMYERITGKQAKSNSLDALVDIALEEWLERQ